MDTFGDFIVGESGQLVGRVVDAAGNAVPNTTLSFESDNPSVAAVGPDGRVTALSVGVTAVTARAVGFAGATSDTHPLSVRDRIGIDSVRPNAVRFGDTLQIFGAGLNPERLLLVALGAAETPIRSYLPDDPEAPDRFGTLTVWAAPPASPRSQVAVISLDGARASPETTLVEQQDLYEPNDTVAWDFGSLGPLDFVLNPALAFEPIGRDDSVRADWYRFRHAQPLDRTIVIKPGTAGPASYAGFVTNTLRVLPGGGWGIGSKSWAIGPGLYACGGFPFEPQQRVPDSTVVALRGLPAGSYDVLALYVREGSYGLALLPGYQSVLPPDAAEENDYCDVAAPLVPGGLASELTIDNPFEVDWFRFTLATADLMNVSVEAAEPTALLDLYVFHDGLPDSLPEEARGLAPGPSNGLTSFFGAGDYFVAVVDFAGRATDYTLVTTLGPQAAAGVSSRRGVTRREPPRSLPRPRVGGAR
jgi:hypothetical protein